jgi:AdoMet-dependent rRNA methyltransferase SPB1
MPPNSTVIGVDLLPIRPIPNVTTFVSDITTPECLATLTRQLNGQKADVVLCDGAPNVGSDYSKDAFVQNELSLSALRLATKFLNRGGAFVTKVYRSRDYNAFIWALRQFFPTIHTVKPDSSRAQSAEIFVLGLNYNAPEKIDPRLLDPNHVFAEIQNDGEQS